MFKITKIYARQILDSRGNPTVETEVFTKMHKGSAIVPSGASTGKYEAKELRDNKKDYFGKSVQRSVYIINTYLDKKLSNFDVLNQEKIDNFLIKLDGTKDKSRLGSNTVLSISLACARCSALIKNKPLYKYLGNPKYLPIPFANIINGGKHSFSKLKFQEFMIAPIKVNSFEEATQLVSETYHELKKILEKKYHSSSVGDEGGFTPKIKYPEQALDLILKAINNLGYEKKIKLAIDAAASEFYYKNKYFIPKKMNSSRLIDYYLNLIKTYPIISLEDPFEQDDFEAFKELTKKSHIQIVGDDLLTTNISRIKIAIEKKLCNCLLLKPNQIGTLTESIEACKLAQKNKFNVMVSHRSGETEDSFISDLSVALNCKQIKLGAPCRGERTCKYNQLLRIAEDKRLKYSKI